MKIIYLVLNDLKILFCNRKTLVVILTINLFISFVALLYFCSFYYEDYARDEKVNQMQKPYYINFEENSRFINDELEEVVTNIIISPKLPDILKITLHSLHIDNHIIGVTLSNQSDYNKFFIVQKGSFFDGSQLEKDDNVAFVSQSFYDSKYELYNVDDAISVDENRYAIIGKGLGDIEEAIYIPYRNFLKNRYPCTQIQINFEKELSNLELELLEKQFAVVDDFIEISIPSISNTNTQEFIFQMMIAIGMIAISIVGIINIFRYLIIINLNKMLIYILCGMNPKKRFIMILIEITIVMSSIYIVSIITIEMFSKYLNITPLSAWQQLGLFITVLLIAITTITINVRKIFNNTIIERI